MKEVALTNNTQRRPVFPSSNQPHQTMFVIQYSSPENQTHPLSSGGYPASQFLSQGETRIPRDKNEMQRVNKARRVLVGAAMAVQ